MSIEEFVGGRAAVEIKGERETKRRVRAPAEARLRLNDKNPILNTVHLAAYQTGDFVVDEKQALPPNTRGRIQVEKMTDVRRYGSVSRVDRWGARWKSL